MTMTMSETVRYYTLEEIAKYNGKDGAKVWVVIKDTVYDVTNYLEEHPGGKELIAECAGTNATAGFDDYGHSTSARNQMKTYKIGELAEEDRRTSKKKKKKKKRTNLNAQESQSRRPFLAALCGGCIT